MAISKLAELVFISPNKNPSRTHKIDSVAIHCMAGNLSIEQCGRLFSKTSTAASSNYGIDSHGRIACYVEEQHRSWCTSSAGVDNRAITIEVANTKNGDPWPISKKAMNSLVMLLVDICRRNKIKSLKWKADKAYGLAAARGGSVSKQNMFAHRWFASKSCPGDYIYDREGSIASQVNKHLKKKTPLKKIPGKVKVIQDEGNSAYESSEYGEEDVPIEVDYTKLHPYIAILGENTRRVVYHKMIEHKVCGAIIEAGQLYQYADGERYKRNRDDSNIIEEQARHLNVFNIPFGIYTVARASSIREAKDEIYRLSFPVRRNPPKLGVWLELDLRNTVSLNNAIMNEYRKQLERIGFKQKIGIIATRESLKTITWSGLQNDWWLLIKDHVKDLKELDRLLDPEFFDIDGK